MADHKGLVIFAVIMAGQMIRGLLRARGGQPAPEAKPDELEAERRTQELREQIQRRRAERQASSPPLAEAPPLHQEPAPPVQPRRIETTQMPEPFGGPLRRVLEEMQRGAQPPAPPPLPAPVIEQRSGELARQEQLAEQMRMLEESRALAKRRATQLAAANYAESQSEGGLRTVSRGKLLDDLRDTESLRRAFVLREVLGPPVGLR